MQDIVIIGGGIGGLATAIALRQRGIRAIITEAAPELRPIGAGIWVPPNAMQVLAQLGLAEAVVQAGVPLRAAEIRDSSSGLLQRMDLATASQRYGYPTVAIQRARLHDILRTALEPGQLQLGKACTRFVETEQVVQVQFADGSMAQAKAVIGADGLRSRVRQQLFPQVALRYSGQSSFRALASLTLPPQLADVGWEVWGAGCRFGFSAVAPDTVYWYATLDASPGVLHEQRPVKASLATLFEDFPAPITAVIAATPEDAIFNTDIYDIRPLARWYQGRVGLVGDAAHATTPNLGQGGAQAIEDAIVLAACFAAYPEPQAAFAHYEQQRRQRAGLVVTSSWRMGKLAHLRNPLLRALRNALLCRMPASLIEQQAEQLFRPNVPYLPTAQPCLNN
jgi:2-polyprenyl-6-methoxyphenol hydroxylase-like FAD-dependent oxidoreductase